MPSFDNLNQVDVASSGGMISGVQNDGETNKKSFTQEVGTQTSEDEKKDSGKTSQRSSGGAGDEADTEVDDFRAGHDTFRAWASGARVANTKGFFCAPPPESKPTKNSDYLRMFVDKLSDGGYGVIALPMSDQLWFNATGDQPTDGNLLMKLIGPKVVGSNDTGKVDFWAAVIFLNGGNVIETSGLFEDVGTVYFNTTLNKFRGRNNSTWVDLG